MHRQPWSKSMANVQKKRNAACAMKLISSHPTACFAHKCISVHVAADHSNRLYVS